MATTRAFMLLAGSALTVVAILAAATRLIGFDLAPFASHYSSAAFWAVVFVTFLAGVLSLVFAPPTRTGERRVDLKKPTNQDALIRPGGSGPSRKNLPVTRTASNPSRTPKKIRSANMPQSSQVNPPGTSEVPPRKEAADPETTHPAHNEAQTSVTPPTAPEPTPVSDRTPTNPHNDNTAPPSTRSTDPNRPPHMDRSFHQSPASASDPVAPEHFDSPQRDPAATFNDQNRQSHAPLQSAHPQAPPSMRASRDRPSINSTTPTQTLRARENNAKNRRERRQQELEERLQTLENRANAAKVSLGLSRISKAGYLQYIKEMERERALIEGELMAINQSA